MSISLLERLTNDFRKFPGIGEKNARKLALFVLTRNLQENEVFIKDLIEIEKKIFKCKECGFIVENGELCQYCQDQNREKKLLVVQNIEDHLLFSGSNLFSGYYHILGGLISPIHGITPDELTIDSLFKRINERKIEEVIFALPSSSDGLITSIYIKNLIKEKYANLKVTKIAEGVPYGKALDEVSLQTINTSLQKRENL